MADNNRLRKIGDGVPDAGAEDIKRYAVYATHEVSQCVKERHINLYNSRIKTTSNKASASKPEDLERHIQTSNENVRIGMEKKEIAIMWAMRKLGYTEDQTSQVLKLANDASGNQEF